MSLEFKGKIIKALPHKSGVSNSTGKQWEIAEYVIEQTEGQYPKKMMFQISGPERIKSIDLKVGEDVDVYFDVDAHEFNERWFNNITVYRVDRMGQNSAQQPQQQQPQQAAQPAQQAQDDLPF